jgi:hypothetical protein
MRLHLAILLIALDVPIALTVAGCGTSAPEAAMPVRDWEYYVAHPAEIDPMQKICREWSGSSAPAASQPAVVTTNCRAAAFAKSQLQLRK